MRISDSPGEKTAGGTTSKVTAGEKGRVESASEPEIQKDLRVSNVSSGAEGPPVGILPGADLVRPTGPSAQRGERILPRKSEEIEGTGSGTISGTGATGSGGVSGMAVSAIGGDQESAGPTSFESMRRRAESQAEGEEILDDLIAGLEGDRHASAHASTRITIAPGDDKVDRILPGDEVVSIPDDAETNAAASKLQAIRRGKKARQEVAAKKLEIAKKTAEEAREALKQAEAEEIDIPDDDETNAAAAKLQAIQRGKQARREIAEKKAAAAAVAAEEALEAAKQTVWVPYMTEDQDAVFFYQAATEESVWYLPENGVIDFAQADDGAAKLARDQYPEEDWVYVVPEDVKELVVEDPNPKAAVGVEEKPVAAEQADPIGEQERSPADGAPPALEEAARPGTAGSLVGLPIAVLTPGERTPEGEGVELLHAVLDAAVRKLAPPDSAASSADDGAIQAKAPGDVSLAREAAEIVESVTRSASARVVTMEKATSVSSRSSAATKSSGSSVTGSSARRPAPPSPPKKPSAEQEEEAAAAPPAPPLASVVEEDELIKTKTDSLIKTRSVEGLTGSGEQEPWARIEEQEPVSDGLGVTKTSVDTVAAGAEEGKAEKKDVEKEPDYGDDFEPDDELRLDDSVVRISAAPEELTFRPGDEDMG